MKKYISKDYIDNILNKYLDKWCGPEYIACSIIKDELDGIPDSALIYMYRCPHCESMTSEEYQYCPYCGKPMECESDGRN